MRLSAVGGELLWPSEIARLIAFVSNLEKIRSFKQYAGSLQSSYRDVCIGGYYSDFV